MHTGFAGDADATACTASGADKSMTEPEERAGWQMHTDFARDVEVGTETTTTLRFGLSVGQKWQGPGSLLPSFVWVHWPQI